MLHEPTLRHEMVRIGRLIYERGWTPAYDGNFSAAIDERWLLTTPAGRCKGMLEPDDLVVVDREGRPRDPGALRPSSELLMHLAVYARRPDVLACVHAHPPLAIACSVAGLDLSAPVLPEILLTLGSIPTAPYATPGTAALGSAIAPLIARHDALILDHHGTLAVGRSLLEGFHRTEQIEQAARIFITARQLGAITPLPAPAVAELLAGRRARGGSLESEPE